MGLLSTTKLLLLAASTFSLAEAFLREREIITITITAPFDIQPSDCAFLTGTFPLSSSEPTLPTSSTDVSIFLTSTAEASSIETTSSGISTEPSGISTSVSVSITATETSESSESALSSLTTSEASVVTELSSPSVSQFVSLTGSVETSESTSIGNTLTSMLSSQIPDSTASDLPTVINSGGDNRGPSHPTESSTTFTTLQTSGSSSEILSLSITATSEIFTSTESSTSESTVLTNPSLETSLTTSESTSLISTETIEALSSTTGSVPSSTLLGASSTESSLEVASLTTTAIALSSTSLNVSSTASSLNVTSPTTVFSTVDSTSEDISLPTTQISQSSFILESVSTIVSSTPETISSLATQTSESSFTSESSSVIETISSQSTNVISTDLSTVTEPTVILTLQTSSVPQSTSGSITETTELLSSTIASDTTLVSTGVASTFEITFTSVQPTTTTEITTGTESSSESSAVETSFVVSSIFEPSTTEITSGSQTISLIETTSLAPSTTEISSSVSLMESFTQTTSLSILGTTSLAPSTTEISGTSEPTSEIPTSSSGLSLSLSVTSSEYSFEPTTSSSAQIELSTSILSSEFSSEASTTSVLSTLTTLLTLTSQSSSEELTSTESSTELTSSIPTISSSILSSSSEAFTATSILPSTASLISSSVISSSSPSCPSPTLINSDFSSGQFGPYWFQPPIPLYQAVVPPEVISHRNPNSGSNHVLNTTIYDSETMMFEQLLEICPQQDFTMTASATLFTPRAASACTLKVCEGFTNKCSRALPLKSSVGLVTKSFKTGRQRGYERHIALAVEYHVRSCRLSESTNPSSLRLCNSMDDLDMSDGAAHDLEAVINFKHEPLNDSSQDIRLVELISAHTPDDPIICNLIHQKLSNENLTHYEALSYTWGELHGSSPILLNGRPFKVSPNLYEALIHLRNMSDSKTRRPKSRWLWIDAVCIDQSNMAERNEQVQRMRSIYQLAGGVVVWLGKTNEPEDEDLVFAPELWGFSNLPANSEFRIPDLMALLVNLNYIYSGDARSFGYIASKNFIERKELWGYLRQIFSRKWFMRLWVIQEVMVQANVVCVVGWTTIDWLNLRQAAELIVRPGIVGMGQEISQFRFLPLMRAHRILKMNLTGVNTNNLLAILRQVEDSKCGDPRDKLFAVKGLITDDQDEDIQIDYSKPLEKVFGDWTWRRINRLRNLDVFSACSDSASSPWRPEAKSTKPLPYIPSWIPDLRYNIARDGPLFYQTHQQYRATQNKRWDCGKFAPFHIERSGDGLRVVLAGVNIDKIVRMSDTAYPAAMSETLRNPISLSTSITAVIDSWEDMVMDHWRPRRMAKAVQISNMFSETLIRGYHVWVEEGEGLSIETLKQKYELWRGHPGPEPTAAQNAPSQTARMERILFAMTNFCQMFITEDGRLGIVAGDCHAWLNDGIWVLPGGQTPFILRNSSDGGYHLLGPCYVHGCMYKESIWELVDKGRTVEKITLV
ncbi:hypothetical protein B7494_g6333 [Chlorociboria aeruginascens]|nr:hypothetical protein B7494_g6333 [Chlorociboria aeruginascens]